MYFNWRHITAVYDEMLVLLQVLVPTCIASSERSLDAR